MGMLYNINDSLEGSNTTSKYAVRFMRQVNLVSTDSDEDSSFAPGDDAERTEVPDIETVSRVSVQAATSFLAKEKVPKIVPIFILFYFIFLCKLIGIYRYIYRRYNTDLR